jgi:kinesin family protein 18/19
MNHNNKKAGIVTPAGGGGNHHPKHHQESKDNLLPPDELEMNEHMKAMWAGQSNILVAVRVRPLMKHDVIKKSCARTLDGKVVVILDPAAGDKQDVLRANRNREKQYAFDFVADPATTQEGMYNNTTKFLIHGVLDGYNATVFAYGQTGSGKVSSNNDKDSILH